MSNPFDSQYNAIRNKIIYYANKYGIDSNIFIWQIWQENKFRSSGCSGAGACGIAQFIPATAQRFNVNRSDIDSSLDGAARYMQWLLARPYINGSYTLALAGYNAGEGNVQKYKGIPPFTETKNYVRQILANAGQPQPTKVIDTPQVNEVVKNNQQTTGEKLPLPQNTQGFTTDELVIGAAILLLLIL